jgi:hypothetical protein
MRRSRIWECLTGDRSPIGPRSSSIRPALGVCLRAAWHLKRARLKVLFSLLWMTTPPCETRRRGRFARSASGPRLSRRSGNFWTRAASQKRRPGKIGGYAAFASHVSCIAGYQCDSVERQFSFKTRVRTCSKRWAPQSVHRICCFLTIRLLTTLIDS